MTLIVSLCTVCVWDETSPVGEATVGGWRGWSRVTTPPRRRSSSRYTAFAFPSAALMSLIWFLSRPIQPDPPEPSGPPHERCTIWALLAYQPVYRPHLSHFCPSFFIFPLLCLWSLHWFSFSEWRQWTNLSETSALLYTLSKTHFWIWAYIIAPKTWLYNIQQCRFAKNSQRDKTKESLNKSHFFSAKTPLTHTLSTVIIKPASFIYISR